MKGQDKALFQAVCAGEDISFDSFDNALSIASGKHVLVEGSEELTDNDLRKEVKTITLTKMSLLHAAIVGDNKRLAKELMKNGADVQASCHRFEYVRCFVRSSRKVQWGDGAPRTSSQLLDAKQLADLVGSSLFIDL